MADLELRISCWDTMRRHLHWTHRLIHALVRLGRHDEAPAAVARLLQIDPGHWVGALSKSFNPKFSTERHEVLLAAGPPE